MYCARSKMPFNSSSRNCAREKPDMTTVADLPLAFSTWLDTTAALEVCAVLYDISTRDVPEAPNTSKSLISGQPPKMKKSSVNARPGHALMVGEMRKLVGVAR